MGRFVGSHGETAFIYRRTSLPPQNGDVPWSRINYSMVRDANGNPDYLVIIIEDINEQKRASEILAAQEAEYLLTLQQRVRERTLELEEANQHLQKEIELNGAGDIQIIDLQAQTLTARLDGVESITASGKAEFVSVDVNGLGSFYGEELDSSKADATIDGMGSVSYLGSAEVTRRLNGAGSVTQLSEQSPDRFGFETASKAIYQSHRDLPRVCRVHRNRLCLA